MGGKTNTGSNSSTTSQSKNNENLGEVDVLEKDQDYWHATTTDYEEENTANGKEITSSIEVRQRFSGTNHQSESLKVKLAKATTPVNCKFLLPKRTNKEIWSNMPTYARLTDVKIQEIQKCHSASVL